VKKKILFIGKPGMGGGYTRFLYLKENLKEYELILASVGKLEKKSKNEPDFFVNIGADFCRKTEKRKLTLEFIKYCKEEEISIIIPMNSPIVVGAIPFLPIETKVVQIVNSDTPRVYKYVTEHIAYVSQLVCLSKRQFDHLSKKLSNEHKNKLKIIPHGLKINYEELPYNNSEKLKIGFLGRVHQGHKNVFLIPEILKNLSIDYEFQLIGDGPDKAQLLSRFEKYGISIIDHGFVANESIGKIIKKWDILLFSSFYEGFGITLIECMNQGVVPIANLLPGITDMIIEDQVSGFLVKDNRVKDYVNILEGLNQDRSRLQQLKENSRKRVIEKFDLVHVIYQYQKVFGEVLLSPKKIPSKDFKDWVPYKEYRPSLWRKILNRVKI
jgi:glycosyltransferase involved in cell wall biosynthesis